MNLTKKFGEETTRERRYVDEQLNRLEDENYRLRKQANDTKATLADSTFNETQMRTQLKKAQTDVVSVIEGCCAGLGKGKVLVFYLYT